ncbi:MAG: AAA family ATPase, partial [Actinobacteria bacterium]|nr:AAA family ATPase [Actinomycetota bacterium]
MTDTDQLITALRARAPKLALVLAGAQAAWPVANELRRRYLAETSYTVKVSSNDEIYDDLHEWVLSLMSASEQRALVAWTGRRSLDTFADDFLQDRPSAELELRLRYDGTRVQTFTVAGHQIKVHISDDGNEGKEGIRSKPAEMVFTAQSLAGREAILAEIAGVLHRSRRASRQPTFRMLDRRGSWTRLDNLAPRGLSSVILPPGQPSLERVITDVARFLGSEPEYLRRCIPWHRGHLYEGPPGTGKTSLARAIASHFGMDVWYLPLADVKADSELLRVASQINPRSMLLLEDVDVFHATTARNDAMAGVTLSGLLNTLDGIATPHGLLTVMTTNTPDVLDEAVVRPGRVDLVEHFGPADEGQVRRLLARWYGTEVPGATGITGVAHADVIEACKRNKTSSGAIADLAPKPQPVAFQHGERFRDRVVGRDRDGDGQAA